MLPVSQLTIPVAIWPEAFRLSRRWMFWIRPFVLYFMRPWTITGNGQGTSDMALCHGKAEEFRVRRPRLQAGAPTSC